MPRREVSLKYHFSVKNGLYICLFMKYTIS
nr:MAG TPA: hypothetical protein [Caudoviricetes sp.]